VRIVCILLCLLLSGCGTEQTGETISDELLIPVMAQPGSISVELPGETALPVVENDSGRVYVCNDYEIVLQTLAGGDMEETFKTVTGLIRDDLTVMETFLDGISRYEFVWAAVGESGDRIGRGVILDDGNYHYCMSILRDTEGTEKSQVNWDQVVSSFRIV